MNQTNDLEITAEEIWWGKVWEDTSNHWSSLCNCKAAPEMWSRWEEGDSIAAWCKIVFPFLSRLVAIKFFLGPISCNKQKIFSSRCRTAKRNMLRSSSSRIHTISGYAARISSTNSEFLCLTESNTAGNNFVSCISEWFNADKSLETQPKNSWTWTCFTFISCICLMQGAAIETKLQTKSFIASEDWSEYALYCSYRRVSEDPILVRTDDWGLKSKTIRFLGGFLKAHEFPNT